MFEGIKEGIKKTMVGVGLAEDSEPAALSSAAATAPVAASPTPAPVAVPVPLGGDAERIAKYDESAKATLQEALQSANVRLIPELQTLLSTLESAIPEEAKRYQTALKIFATKGTPVAAILSEYDVYIGCLEEKARTFSKELQDQLDARVGSKRNAVQDYDTQIEAAKAQIASLEKQLVDLNEKRASDLSALANEQRKLDLVQQRFTLQYDAARARVDQQKAQVAEHGKGC